MFDLVFNELSTNPPAVDRALAYDRMAQLIDVLLCAPDQGIKGGLRIPQHFYLLELAPDYRLMDWLYDGQVSREQSGFLLQLATKSPYLDQAPAEVIEREQLVDVTFQGQGADALRAAYLLDVPIVSLNQMPWDQALIDCQCQELVDESLGPVVSLTLPNLSAVAHYPVHATWISERRRRSVVSMTDFWIRRHELLPALDICPSVEHQIQDITPGELRFQQILNRLFELDTYFSAWTEGPFNPDAFAKCNPASPATLSRYSEYYRFWTTDGQQVTAHWHLYFTPGKGRIYFDADGKTRRGILCHIGDKLPDTTYGHS